MIPITSSYSYGSLLEVEMGVVGSDLWRFASFSPSSSRGPILSIKVVGQSRHWQG